jgi:hypothetical protein
MTLGSMVDSAMAQERTVGVSEGDWFKYSLAFHWNSNDPNATIPPFSEVEWISVSIVSVSGTSVTFQSVAHLKNGSEPIQVVFIDVDTGIGAAWSIISANLDPNDALYVSGEYSAWKIRETTTRTYPGRTRETNHAYNATELDVAEFHSHTFKEGYWDRSTGMLVEMIGNVQKFETDGSQMNVSITMTIIESNVWTISETAPEFPLSVSMPLILIALAVTIVSYRKRLLKMPTQ